MVERASSGRRVATVIGRIPGMVVGVLLVLVAVAGPSIGVSGWVRPAYLVFGFVYAGAAVHDAWATWTGRRSPRPVVFGNWKRSGRLVREADFFWPEALANLTGPVCLVLAVLSAAWSRTGTGTPGGETGRTGPYVVVAGVVAVAGTVLVVLSWIRATRRGRRPDPDDRSDVGVVASHPPVVDPPSLLAPAVQHPATVDPLQSFRQPDQHPSEAFSAMTGTIAAAWRAQRSGGSPEAGVTSAPVGSPAAGWYQDPQGAGLRWWDGQAWTEHRA